MAEHEHGGWHILLVAVLVCLVCGVVVSATAVALRPMQQENRLHFRHVNILQAADMYSSDMDVEAAFARIERRFVELETGKQVDMPMEYDPWRAAREPEQSRRLEKDPARIRRVPKVAEVWLIRDEAGKLQRVVLPVHGFGAWSVMFGFLALEPDLNTVAGITFYDHSETPGLGGEIDNPRWQQKWEGKRLFDEAGEVAIQVVKGSVERGDSAYAHKVDGISGATVTSRGVNNLVQFWVGESGYGPYLNRLREELANSAR
jgi:Na+-transporting NADH:ubiquinone oxidoreductase subunit C